MSFMFSTMFRSINKQLIFCSFFVTDNGSIDFAKQRMYFQGNYKVDHATLALEALLYSMVGSKIPFRSTQAIAEGRLQFKFTQDFQQQFCLCSLYLFLLA